MRNIFYQSEMTKPHLKLFRQASTARLLHSDNNLKFSGKTLLFLRLRRIDPKIVIPYSLQIEEIR